MYYLSATILVSVLRSIGPMVIETNVRSWIVRMRMASVRSASADEMKRMGDSTRTYPDIKLTLTNTRGGYYSASYIFRKENEE